MNPELKNLDEQDQAMIEAAHATLRRCYRPDRHTVAAAVLCGSGRIYTGVNIDTCGYGPCAEPVALGAAITAGEREILAIVAVHRNGSGHEILSPCGNCRQLLLDYAPDAMVILPADAAPGKTQARHLLPGPYLGFRE